MTTGVYRATRALLPHLRMWEGTKIIDPRNTSLIRQAVHEFASAHSIGDVRVLIEPCKPKAHFTITQVSRGSARADYDRAIEWTAGSGEVALLTDLVWLADASYPLGSSDVYVVSVNTWATEIALAWFVFGRKREGRWWSL